MVKHKIYEKNTLRSITIIVILLALIGIADASGIVSSPTTSLSMNVGETRDIYFTVNNNAGITADPHAYLTLTVSSGLTITGKTVTSAGDAAITQFSQMSRGSSGCWYSNDVQGTCIDELLDAYEQYSAGETNTFKITVKALNNGNHWVKYRTAFLPSGSSTYLRYPTSGSEKDFQGWYVFKIPVTISLPPLSVSVSANSPQTSSQRTSTVTATVTSGGGPSSGATVSFTANGGSMNPASCTTGSDGKCTSTYNAPSVSSTTTYTVTATASKSGYSSGTGSVGIQVNPLPSPSVTSTTTSLSMNVGETRDIYFTVTNNGGITADPHGYLTLTVSSGLAITGKTVTSAGDAAVTQFGQMTRGSSGCWYSNEVQGTCVDELLDAYEQYSAGETNTIKITVQALSTGSYWIKYRTAFLPVGGGSYVRYPSTGSETGFQGWYVFKIPVTISPPPLSVSVSANSPQTSSQRTSTVTATVTSGGSPSSGATVSFTANGGSMNPASCTTGSDGKCTSTYNAPSVSSTTTYTVTATASKSGYSSGTGSVGILVNPLPSPYVSTPITSLSMNVGETRDIYFTVTNNGGITAYPHGYLTLTVSSGLTITGKTVTSAGDAAITQFGQMTRGSSGCWYSNDVQGTCVDELLDVFEQYSAGETNTIKITVKALSTGDHWIKYRTAFLPIGGGNYVRYPSSGSEIGFQGWYVSKIPVTISQPLSTSISANPPQTSSQRTSTVTATVTSGGGPSSGATVSFTANGGSITPGSCTTGSDGKCTSTYNAPIVSSTTTYTVTATASKSGYSSGTGSVGIPVNPLPSASLTSPTASLSMNVGETKDIYFTVTNNGGITADPHGYLTLTVSSGLTITGKTVTSAGDAAITQFGQMTRGSSGCWYSNDVQGTCVDELLDAYEQYSAGETNTIKITVKALSTGSHWIKYRTAFLPIGGGSYVRYPSSGSEIGFQGWYVFKIPVTISEPLSVSVSANPPQTSSQRTSTVTATVTSGGSPSSGATVSFTANGGSMNPASCTTGSDGKCTSTYNAPSVSSTTTYTVTSTASKSGYSSGTGSVGIPVNPLPSPSVTSTTTSLSMNVGETRDIYFTVVNNGGITADPHGYLTLTVSSGLTITGKTVTSAGDAAVTQFGQMTRGSSGCWYSNDVQGTCVDELLDAYEQYSAGETNTIKITVQALSTGDHWIKYRTAFLPIGGTTYVRYPNTGLEKDFQGWNVFKIPIKVQSLNAIETIKSYMVSRTFKSTLSTESTILPELYTYIENVLYNSGINKASYSSVVFPLSSSNYYLKYNNKIYIPIRIHISSSDPSNVVHTYIDISDNSLVTDKKEYANVKLLEILAIAANMDLSPEYHNEIYNNFLDDRAWAESLQNNEKYFGHGFTTLEVATSATAIISTGGVIGAAGTGSLGSAAIAGLTTSENLIRIGDDTLLALQGLSVETKYYDLYFDIDKIIKNQNIQDIQSKVNDLGVANTVAIDIPKMYAGHVALTEMRAAFDNQWVEDALKHTGEHGFLTERVLEAQDDLKGTNLVGVVDTLLGLFTISMTDQARTNYLNSINFAQISSINNKLANYQNKIKDGSIDEAGMKDYFQLWIYSEIIKAVIYKNSADQAKNNMWGEIFNIEYPRILYNGYNFIGNYLTGDSTEDAITNLNHYSTKSIESANIIRTNTFDHWIILDDYSNFNRWLSNIDTSDTTPPIANAGPDQTAKVVDIVYFNGSTSKDNVGIISYLWNFGDPNSAKNEANGIFSSHIYESPGTYTVTLSVNDAKNNGPVIDTLNVIVGSKNYNVGLLPAALSKTVSTDSIASYELIIKNTGNVDDTFKVNADRGTLSGTSFPLKVGQTSIFTFQDSSSTQGTYTAKITATSIGDSLKSSIATVTTIVTNNPPNQLSSLNQYKLDQNIIIPIGSTTSENSVVMKAIVSDIDNDNVQLEAEIRPIGTTFSNTPNCTSGPAIASGNIASATCSGLTDGQYHWQARAKDSNGAYSDWLSFGGNFESRPDFMVDSTPPEIISKTPEGSIVSVGTKISVIFNEAMNEVSVKSAFSISPFVIGNYSWNGNAMTYSPNYNLDYGTKYTISIGTGAKDLAGNSLALPFSWQFTTKPQALPVITTHPADQTVSVGQNATFSVTATGIAPLTYQWQKNGEDIPGATSATYTTPATALADNGATFRVNVSNIAGSVMSNSATLAIVTVPDNQYNISFDTSPRASPIPINIDSVEYLSSQLPKTFKWERNSQHSVSVNPIVEEPVFCILVTGVTCPPETRYLFNSWNDSNTQTSRTIIVSDNASYIARYNTQYYLYVITSPENIALIPGSGWYDNGTSVSLIAPPVFGYSFKGWIVDGNSKSENSININMTSHHTITAVYQSTTLTITTQPMNQTVNVGQNATFTVVATGTAPLTYKWQKNGTDIPGAISASYTTPATTLADNGTTFRINVSNAAGSVISNTAILTVISPPNLSEDIEAEVTSIWGSSRPIIIFGQNSALGGIVKSDLETSPISESLPSYTVCLGPRNSDKSVISRFKISDTKVKIVADITGGTGYYPGSKGYIKIINPEWKITEILPANMEGTGNWSMATNYEGTGVNIDINNGTITWYGRGGCPACACYENGIRMEFIVEKASTFTVHNINKGTHYTTIQAAINNASPGDEIRVDSGIYPENVNVNKRLTLRGVGMPVVDARGSGNAITLSENGIILEGFTATGGGNYFEAGIKTTSSSNKLSGNNASNNGVFGILLSSSSNNNELFGNNANSNNADGIRLESLSNNNTLTENYANSNKNQGIHLYSSSNNTLIRNYASNNNGTGISVYSSSNNTLSDNNASNNYDGIGLGFSSNNLLNGNIVLNNYFFIDWEGSHHGNGYGINIGFSSNNNTLLGNIASTNYDGIVLSYSSNNLLSGNNAKSNNNIGIVLSSSSNNLLSGNNATSNNNYGIFLFSPINNNEIYNNIFNNNNNVGFYGSNVNTWNITKQSGPNIIGGTNIGGNFWANPDGSGFSQTCEDGNKDGICDSAYTLDSTNIDYLPLAYNATTVIPSITVISPNGVENWERGKVYAITWNYTGSPGTNVKIELLKNGVVNRLITSSTSIGSSGSGSYNWLINSIQTLGTDYKIRITSTTNSEYTDTSNNSFTIGALKSINLIKNPGFESLTANWIFNTNGTGTFTVASPGFEGTKAAQIVLGIGDSNIQLYQTGITLEENKRYRLSFSSYSTTGNDLRIILHKHGSPYTVYGLNQTIDIGTNWQNFMIEFTTENFTGTENDVRFRFYLAQYAEAGDTYYIDNVFLEKVSSITVTSPNGGENLTRGKTHSINWSSTGSPGTYIKIELLKPGAANKVIISSTLNDGSHPWPILATQAPGNDYKIKITSTTNAAYTDTSDNSFTIPAPSFTIVSPNGGENWTRGKTQTIKWNSTESPGTYVKIELLKAGVLNRVIVASTLNDGSHPWLIPGTQIPGTDYKVRITSNANISNMDTSDNNFTIPAPSITVVSPNGGENGRRGTTQTIKWNSTENPKSYVKIELLKPGKANKVIISSTLNDGSHPWLIPATQLPGDEYRVKITSTINASVNDTSDNPFTIPAPSFTVVSPNGGENWTRGTTQTIRWNSTESPKSYVKIELIKPGVANKVIIASTLNDGSQPWLIPATQLPGDDYKVKITSTINASVNDTSDNNFSIVPPKITVTSPNGGQTWIRGTTHPITWNYTGNPGTYVKIELLKGGALNRTILSSTPNDKSQSWTIPAAQIPGTDYKIKITSTTNLVYNDISDSNFNISAATP